MGQKQGGCYLHACTAKPNPTTSQTLKHIKFFIDSESVDKQKTFNTFAEKASNQSLKFDIFMCNPMESLFSGAPLRMSYLVVVDI